MVWSPIPQIDLLFTFFNKRERFQSNTSHFAAQSGVSPRYLTFCIPYHLFPVSLFSRPLTDWPWYIGPLSLFFNTKVMCRLLWGIQGYQMSSVCCWCNSFFDPVLFCVPTLFFQFFLSFLWSHSLVFSGRCSYKYIYIWSRQRYISGQVLCLLSVAHHNATSISEDEKRWRVDRFSVFLSFIRLLLCKAWEAQYPCLPKKLVNWVLVSWCQ